MAHVQGYSQADLLNELDRLGIFSSKATHAWLGKGEPDIFPCSNIPLHEIPISSAELRNFKQSQSILMSKH